MGTQLTDGTGEANEAMGKMIRKGHARLYFKRIFHFAFTHSELRTTLNEILLSK